MKRPYNHFRMSHWFLFAVIFYGIAIALTQSEILPQLQVISWKLGHETIASYFGYWIDRSAFNQSRLNEESPPLLQIRRAIIIGAAMLAVAMGL
jgi:hypothetical protein